VVVSEYIELEAVDIQTMTFVFPFSCVPDSLGRLKISI